MTKSVTFLHFVSLCNVYVTVGECVYHAYWALE